MNPDDLRLFVTVDKRLYRDALLYQLLLEDDIDLVGESATGVSTLDQLAKAHADVLLIEEALPDNDGLTISEVALSQHPTLRILLLVDQPVSPNRLAIYLDAGIKAVIAKTRPVQELVRALGYIRHGQVYVDAASYVPAANDARPPELDAFRSLSSREREVARLMAQRIAVKTIAEQLGVSYKTVHSYKDRIFVKMGFERLPDLMLFMKRFRNRLDL